MIAASVSQKWVNAVSFCSSNIAIDAVTNFVNKETYFNF